MQINEKKAKFFLEYLASLKEGIVEKIDIQKEPLFEAVTSKKEVVHRIAQAEDNAQFCSHEEFWRDMGV
ncbi:MAG: hypothetical protein IBX45_11300 [Campylobacterales bacterium]|nr:hypothetical protein [Campylobacterales bacterium]